MRTGHFLGRKARQNIRGMLLRTRNYKLIYLIFAHFLMHFLHSELKSHRKKMNDSHLFFSDTTKPHSSIKHSWQWHASHRSPFLLVVGRIGSITLPGTLVPWGANPANNNLIPSHSFWQLENWAADDACTNHLQIVSFEYRWTGHSVLRISSGLYLCEHVSVNPTWIFEKMWHCRWSLSPVDDERSTSPRVQESKVRSHLLSQSFRGILNRFDQCIGCIRCIRRPVSHTANTVRQKRPNVPYPVVQWKFYQCLSLENRLKDF